MKWNERRKSKEKVRGKRGQEKQPREAEGEAKNGNDLMTLRKDMHIC